MSFSLGIAFYEQLDNRRICGRPVGPHWALIAQPTDPAFLAYTAPNTFIYQITRQPQTNAWALNHLAQASIHHATSPSQRLMGIIHLKTFKPTSRHPLSLEELDRLVRMFNAKWDHRDESDIPVWSCEGWVIRVLRELGMRGYLTLPNRLKDIYPTINARLMEMKHMQRDPRMSFPVIRFM